MMKKIISILSLFVTLVLIVSVFTGCGVDIPLPSVSSGLSESSIPESSDPKQNESSDQDSLSENEPSSDPVPQESEPVSEPEPSSEPSDVSEPVSDITNPELPYASINLLKYSDIGFDPLDAYFENSVFIGNSVMVHFKNFYSNKKSVVSGFLGKPFIFCSSNYSAREDLKEISVDTWQPSYDGAKSHSWDAVAAMGAKTVYLNLMALNELGLHSTVKCVRETFENTVEMMNRIKASNPGITFVILSNTYMVYNYNNYKNLNNQHISELNNMMLEYCNQNGIDFIDVSTFLMDGNVLSDSYCRDAEKKDGNSGCHLTNDAYAMWTATLRNYAFAKQNGFWENPSEMPLYEKNPQ